MSDALELIPLGGCGGFGMNATLIAWRDDALLLDFGVGFAGDDSAPQLRAVIDPSPLIARWPTLRAIVLTHAHDDHVAGLPQLPDAWRRTPVLGRGFTIAMARTRFEDAGVSAPDWQVVTDDAAVPLGPFRVRLIDATHSVPHNTMLVIETPVGTVVHSGDFKLDDDPVRGPRTDRAALQQVGAAGVRLLLLDSTGALRPGLTASESTLAEPLTDAIAGARGQVFASTFASHLHRIQLLAQAAAAHGRSVGLLGMRAATSLRLGIDLGLFDAPPGRIVPLETLRQLPPERRFYICGGCQAEPDSSLARLSRGADTRAAVRPDDLVLLSASIIPGNERVVGRMVNRFLRAGVEVLQAAHTPGLHVSGHASREELNTLIGWLRPRAVLPVHGDRLHLLACQRLALAHPAAPRQAPVLETGETLLVHADALALGTRHTLETIWHEEGRPLLPAAWAARRRLASGGVAAVTIAVHGDRIETRVEQAGLGGVPDPAFERLVHDAVAEVVRREQSRLPREALEQDLARRLGSLLRRGGRARPEVFVSIVAREES